MFPFSVVELAGVMNASVLQEGNNGITFSSVCTDSRSVKDQDLFFALRGERSDGHQFAAGAVSAGAAGLVLERPVEGIPAGVTIFTVKNTLKALQDLAAHNRQRSGVPVVGVTGSSGKTTTKDLIYSVLSSRYNTLKTEGNYNNELGLPLTLLRLDGTYGAAVVEMAMRGPGEIDFLCRIASPDGAVITNIGEAHFERLGSVDNIARAKGEILDHISDRGFAVLHGESPYIGREAARCLGRVIFFGEDQALDVFARDVEAVDGGNRFIASVMGVEEQFFVPLPGRHNVVNSLSAIAVGMELGLDIKSVRKGLSGASLSAMRLEIVNLNGVSIINDSYNANPSSARAALQTLAELSGGARKIAVLGDMLELGEKSEPGHREVGRWACESGVDLLAAVGNLAEYIGAGAREAGMPSSNIQYYSTAPEAARELKKGIRAGDFVLVKGSRGMRMEEFVNSLREDKG
ncbi:MAG: UDP-N-acetylmuramoylalanyl-D-glutamate--2,6-diaminopimelate ligase [Peptococcaceae bacterium BICA1-7]|nr:MAG: UDP-N-acetylmuramoylalanyl-D-glutamate--2,6-diaminopimelate ligase [Peptococcaceae bacterium BICA1-7]HBV99007.1 UDP-N-acetylmuramoyl-tripeptide--D-alanyl-D-alanine ligase [Desulfotomaculum sp.]